MAKRYITEVTAQELEDMIAVSKIHAGEGITLTRDNEGIEVKIDLIQLKQWIQTVMSGDHII